MRKIVLSLLITALFVSCGDTGKMILPRSAGSFNKVLVVSKGGLWQGEVGDEIRNSFSKLLVGLPQPEKTLSLAQIGPNGFNTMMKKNRSIMITEVSDEENLTTVYNKYATPQTVVYVSAKDKESLRLMIEKNHKKIIKIFKDSDIRLLQNVFAKKRLDDSQYKTFQNLKISLTIPEEFRTVDDTGDFLWLRQHLSSGIARGAGSNNILVYSLPLDGKTETPDNIIAMRDAIGEKYIPGSREGMHMITEAAYTPLTVETKLKGLKTFETRGKWEMKNNFMAGPFLNYAMVDKKNNRLLVVEGFTYAPSVNKREFVFELEAIAKSINFN